MDVFTSLKSKSILNLFASTGRFLGLEVKFFFKIFHKSITKKISISKFQGSLHKKAFVFIAPTIDMSYIESLRFQGWDIQVST